MLRLRHYVGMGIQASNKLSTSLSAAAAELVRNGFVRALQVEPGDPSFSTEGDAGWFGPDSVVWRVHSDLSTLAGGLRALLYQTLHPLAIAGVADHSDYRHDPWGRLHRTAEFVAATTYGTTEEAQAAIDLVKRVHLRVKGVAPDGRAYSATDPDLLAWVHATEVDSFLAAYNRYGPGLNPTDADRYVAEMALVGRALDADPVPESVAELAEVISRYRLHASAQARDALKFLVFPPIDWKLRPAYGLVTAAAIELLPIPAQLELRLVSPPLAGPVAVRPVLRTLLGTLRWALGEAPALAAARLRTAPDTSPLKENLHETT